MAPSIGYKFGDDLFELSTATRLDIIGAPVVRVIVDAFIDASRSITFLYSHQEARSEVSTPGGPPARVKVSVDQWHLGGTVEVGRNRVRPFYGADVGFTRFGGGDAAVRFSVGGGGGVKLTPSRHVGIRFDGRAYMVIVHGTAAAVCTTGRCAIGLNVAPVWQLEFTTGLVFAF